MTLTPTATQTVPGPVRVPSPPYPATRFAGTRPVEPGAGDVTSKVLKVLKVLNFSGAGEGNTFTCTFTFTGGGAEGPDPVASGNAFILGRDALSLARRIERAASDLRCVSTCLERT